MPGPGAHLRGAISISPSIEYMERAYDDAKYGHFSRRPYIDMVIPSLTDPSVAPPGKHVLSCFVQYAPYKLAQGTWDDQREAFGDTVVDTIAEHAPNIKKIIIGRQVLTPLDLEREFGLTQGNIFQGELSLEQLFFLRPVPGWAYYRTPIDNLYMCGSATHPGGGIMGAPGRIASQVILKEWKKVRLQLRDPTRTRPASRISTRPSTSGRTSPCRHQTRPRTATSSPPRRARTEREKLTMPIGQRVVLIGGGHNALITAFYLAKGGFKPLVLERREIVGGGAITEEFHPGFRASTLAHTVGPLRADVARDMQLEKYDCHMLLPGPARLRAHARRQGAALLQRSRQDRRRHRPLLRERRRELHGICRSARGNCRSLRATSRPSLRPPSIRLRLKISGIFSRPDAAFAGSARTASSICSAGAPWRRPILSPNFSKPN